MKKNNLKVVKIDKNKSLFNYEKKILIKELTLDLKLGYYDFEKEKPQKVKFSLEIDYEDNLFFVFGKESVGLSKDIITARTNYGVPKDDLQFNLGGLPLKKYASQGQQKSYVIALKLAHYSFLQLKKGYKPILMLDDIFDKLDEQRIRKLLAMVGEDSFGQLFITDTDQNRVAKIFKDLQIDCRIFEVSKGLVVDTKNN